MRRIAAIGALVIAGTLATAGWLAAPCAAAAHALPQSSEPAPGANLAATPSAVTITFGERPDPKLSSIKVLDRSGASVTAGPTTGVASRPLALNVLLKPLAQGVYTVAWRTVSAVDGHLASGSFAFGVGVAPSVGPSGSPGSVATASGGPSLTSVTGRWLLYLGLIVLLGGALFGLVIAPAPAALVRRAIPAAWVIAAIGAIVVVGTEIVDAGVDPSRALETSLGAGMVARAATLLVAGIGVVLAARGPGAPRAGLAVLLMGSTGAVLADVATSHAAAGVYIAYDLAVQAVHALASAAWVGGLVGLLLATRREPGPETARIARRFSWLATGGIAVVAMTGLLRAIAEIGTVDRLFSTDFGLLVIAKTGLFAALALAGAVNHFRNVPRAGRLLGGLRRLGTTEFLVGATVVLLSASLVNVAPPVASAGGGTAGPAPEATPPAAPLLVEGHDFGTSVKVRLEVTPGTAGFDTFRATVIDFDSGAPVAASGVTLRFAFPAREDVGGSRLDLPPTGSGAYGGTGGNLSLDGAWDVTALVARGAASVEVPLQLITRTPPPQIDVNAVSGLPTIYTAHLSTGRTVQVYLDPGGAGANEVHATFFDPAGNELRVPTVAMTLGLAGQPALPLSPRLLELGHFVADSTLSAGTYTLSIAGTAPNGDQLVTQLNVTVGPAASPGPGAS